MDGLRALKKEREWADDHFSWKPEWRKMRMTIWKEALGSVVVATVIGSGVVWDQSVLSRLETTEQELRKLAASGRR